MSIMFDGNPDKRVVFAMPKPKDSSTISVGAIVGIVVGGVLFVLLGAHSVLALVLFTSSFCVTFFFWYARFSTGGAWACRAWLSLEMSHS